MHAPSSISTWFNVHARNRNSMLRHTASLSIKSCINSQQVNLINLFFRKVRRSDQVTFTFPTTPFSPKCRPEQLTLILNVIISTNIVRTELLQFANKIKKDNTRKDRYFGLIDRAISSRSQQTRDGMVQEKYFQREWETTSRLILNHPIHTIQHFLPPSPGTATGEPLLTKLTNL